MKVISRVTKGPTGLVRILNGIISALNGMKLIQGAGIYITPTDEGWIISTTPPLAATSGSTGSGGNSSPVSAGSWVSVNVMDDECNASTIQVWAITS